MVLWQVRAILGESNMSTITADMLLLAPSHECSSKAFGTTSEETQPAQRSSAPKQDMIASSATHHELFNTKFEKLAIDTNASWVLDRR